jgi:hypothetical protein
MRFDTRHHRLNYFLGAPFVEVFFGFLALKQQYHSPIDLVGCQQISDLVPFATIHRHVLVSSPVSPEKPMILGGFVAHSLGTHGISVSKFLSVIPVSRSVP